MIEVFDFFSGCGGTSLGFKQAGFKILGGLDCDIDSAKTFKYNFPKSGFILDDIRKVNPESLKGIIPKNRKNPLLFSSCAPCQPFSGQRRVVPENDPRKSLLEELQRFISHWEPEYLFIENVPGIQHINKSGGVFNRFTKFLDNLSYKYDSKVIDTYNLGVPQHRKRFVLIASSPKVNIKPIDAYLLNLKPENLILRDLIRDLPSIKAGETHPNIPNHQAAKLSELNLERIKATPEGGDRRNWPKKLHPKCHADYKGHTDVYGRMSWELPAPTLTTKCISYSNGRFGHPEQNRAISVREAARIQTFPDNFIFIGNIGSCARQVGNAVPPLMAKELSNLFC